MKKIVVSLFVLAVLQSCIVSTAAKAVKGVAKIGYKAVKGTVKGVSWAVSKANGKIDKDRIDGNWKVVGIYHGSFADFSVDQNPESSFNSECVDGFDQIIFNSKSRSSSLCIAILKRKAGKNMISSLVKTL